MKDHLFLPFLATLLACFPPKAPEDTSARDILGCDGDETTPTTLPTADAILTGAEVQGAVGAGDMDGDGIVDLAAYGTVESEDGYTPTVWFLPSPVYGETDVQSAAASVLSDGGVRSEDAFWHQVFRGGDLTGDRLDDIVLKRAYEDDRQTADIVVLESPIDLADPLASTAAVISLTSYSAIRPATVDSAGDVNGDGIGDLVAGTSYLGEGTGAAVVHGPVSGEYVLETDADWYLIAQWPDEVDRTSLGLTVAGGFDLNGDGYDDIAVTDHWGSNPTGHYLCGATYVLYGPLSGELNAGRVPDVIHGQREESLGYAVTGVPDIDGDGFDELLIGAPNWPDAATYVFSGPVSGTSRSSDAFAAFGRYDDGLDQYQPGYSVTTGDPNGDGQPDFLIGSPVLWMQSSGLGYPSWDGMAMLVLGPLEKAVVELGPLRGNIDLDCSDTIYMADSTVYPDGGAGAFVDARPDLDGDGLTDILIGSTKDYDRTYENHRTTGTNTMYLFYSKSPGP